MSTPVTEGHRELLHQLLMNVEHGYLKEAAQLIADSEAKAVEAERARLYGIGRKKGEQPVSSDMDIGHRCLSGDKWPQPVDPIAECARLGRELADSIAERDQLRAEVERLKKQIKDDNRSYGCELRDPYGTIWEQATKDHDRAKKAERALAELREWQAGVIANERLHHAERKESIARAEKTEAEVIALKAQRGQSDYYAAALSAEAELAAERARLDWLELRGPWDSWNGFGETGITLRENIRAVIDAAMKEDTK